MVRPKAARVATVAGRCTVLLFAATVVSCGMAGDANLGPVLFAFVLFVLALASLIVWLTARDIAGDEPPAGRGPSDRS